MRFSLVNFGKPATAPELPLLGIAVGCESCQLGDGFRLVFVFFGMAKKKAKQSEILSQSFNQVALKFQVLN